MKNPQDLDDLLLYTTHSDIKQRRDGGSRVPLSSIRR